MFPNLRSKLFESNLEEKKGKKFSHNLLNSRTAYAGPKPYSPHTAWKNVWTIHTVCQISHNSIKTIFYSIKKNYLFFFKKRGALR